MVLWGEKSAPSRFEEVFLGGYRLEKESHMHLAEGVLPLSQAIGWSALAAPVLIWSIRGEELARRDDTSSSTVMASVTSLLFAATLLPLPVPVVGATSHICLTPLFALIVGVRRIVWPTFFVLLLMLNNLYLHICASM